MFSVDMAISLHFVFYLILYISALVANKRVHIKLAVCVYDCSYCRLGVFGGGDAGWVRCRGEGISSVSASTPRPTATTRQASQGQGRQRSKGICAFTPGEVLFCEFC